MRSRPQMSREHDLRSFWNANPLACKASTQNSQFVRPILCAALWHVTIQHYGSQRTAKRTSTSKEAWRFPPIVLAKYRGTAIHREWMVPHLS